MIKGTIQLIAFAISITSVAIANAQKPIPKLTDRSKQGILSYFKTIINNRQVIVGQQCSESPDVALDYEKNFQRLYDSTGKYPALLGLEYGYFSNMNLANVSRLAEAHWKKGGLVTISWHADNPFTDGYNVRWNSIKKKDSISFGSLLKNAPDSKEKRNYRKELEKVAGALKQLKESGVMVLWRPFHEVNGDWFWWGANDVKNPSNKKDFQALWKDMYETLTKDFGLDNLIWVYSPYQAERNFVPVSYMYPGDAYVDLVAVDNYSAEPDFPDYDELRTIKKIITNGEIGPAKERQGSFDELKILDAFKGKAAYFLQWHSWTNARVAIIDNAKYKEMMNDPAAITLDKIK